MPPKWRKVALSIIPKKGAKGCFFSNPFLVMYWYVIMDSTVIGWFFGFELISCMFFSTDHKKPLRFIALPQNQDTVKGTGYAQLLSWIGLGGCVFSSINILGQSASCMLPTPKQGEALKGVFVPQWMSGTINSTNWDLVSEAFRDQVLRPGTASKLYGCLTFLNTGCYGKLGRAGLNSNQGKTASFLGASHKIQAGLWLRS